MKKITVIVIILAVVGAGVYFFMMHPIKTGNQAVTATSTVSDTSGATSEAIAGISGYKYTENYASPAHSFTFKYPKDFTVSEIPNDNGGEAIVIQNPSTKVGVQIVISKFDGGDIDLTEDYLKNNVPDMKISESQELLVGPNRKGLAFLSNNSNFGGKSREVWFVWRGYLYQISTYAELDPFLKGLFATWQFSKS